MNPLSKLQNKLLTMTAKPLRILAIPGISRLARFSRVDAGVLRVEVRADVLPESLQQPGKDPAKYAAGMDVAIDPNTPESHLEMLTLVSIMQTSEQGSLEYEIGMAAVLHLSSPTRN